jgi:Flp pilus assembly protein TadG
MRYLPLGRRRRRRGAVAAQVAIILTALLGVTAIALDGGLLLARQRQVQAAADAAALAAATALYSNRGSITSGTPDPGGAGATSGQNVATANGCTATINIPPKSGSFVNQLGYAEAIVTYNRPRYFSVFLGSGTITVKARAVASVQSQNWGASILTLGTTGTDLTLTGSATITVPGAVLDNSSDSKAASTSSTAKIVAPSIAIVGNYSGTGYSPTPTTGATATSDPFTNLAAPDTTGMTVINPGQNGPYKPSGSSVTLQPGVYNGGLTLSNQNVLLASGTYYLKGPLTLNGSGILTSGTQLPSPASTLPPDGTRTNVLIYVDPGSATQGLTISGWTVQLRPLASGTYQGISIFQKQSSTAKIDMSNMQTYTYIEGMIYAAGADMTLSGGSNIIIGTSFISKTMTLSGSSSFTIPPANIPVPWPGKSQGIGLVE